MAQENENTGTESTEAQATEEQEPQQTETTEEPTEATEEQASEESQEESLPDDTPEWVQKELRKTREEAAKYRTRLREAEEKLAGAKTAEEFEAALTEMRTKNAELENSLLRADVARRFGLPDDLAARLQGADKAALEADAKSLQRYVTTNHEPDLSGGLDPSDGGEADFDPVVLARQARARRY